MPTTAKKQNFWQRHIASFFKRKSASELIVYSIVLCIFLFFAATYLYCVFWLIMSSLKTHTEIVLAPFALPEKLQWTNFGELSELFVVNKTNFGGMFANSVYFSVLGSFLSVNATSMLAYISTKYKFKGSGLIYTCSLMMITLPIFGSGGSMYRLIYNLGWINTPWMLLTSIGGFGIYFMYFNAFYQNVSWSYAEAAQLDGAGEYTIYFKIMLPQAMPMMIALFVMIWQGSWNDFSSAIIYHPKLPTLPVGIYLFQQDMVRHARMDLLYAASFVTCVPPVVMYIFFNKFLVNNVSLGGIKE